MKNEDVLLISLIRLELKKMIEESLQSLSSQPVNNLYITRNETAEILRVTLPTLSDWTKKGKIQSYQIGSRIRYKRCEIMDFVQSGLTQKKYDNTNKH